MSEIRIKHVDRSRLCHEYSNDSWVKMEKSNFQEQIAHSESGGVRCIPALLLPLVLPTQSSSNLLWAWNPPLSSKLADFHSQMQYTLCLACKFPRAVGWLMLEMFSQDHSLEHKSVVEAALQSLKTMASFENHLSFADIWSSAIRWIAPLPSDLTIFTKLPHNVTLGAFLLHTTQT